MEDFCDTIDGEIKVWKERFFDLFKDQDEIAIFVNELVDGISADRYQVGRFNKVGETYFFETDHEKHSDKEIDNVIYNFIAFYEGLSINPLEDEIEFE
jgi:hypothetical protein